MVPQAIQLSVESVEHLLDSKGWATEYFDNIEEALAWKDRAADTLPALVTSDTDQRLQLIKEILMCLSLLKLMNSEGCSLQ